jgi:hypothetical protein
LAAAQATNEIIYTQDDDCIVHNIPELLAAFSAKQLVCAMKTNAAQQYMSYTRGSSSPTLVGWGSVFLRSWVSVLDRYLERFGEDSLLRREADRLFTALLPSPHVTLPANVEDFPCASDAGALWRDPEHGRYRAAALDRALRLLDESRTGDR